VLSDDIVVEGPDGVRYAFPEGTTEPEMRAAMISVYGGRTDAE
jgi:hypothetical protein